MSSAPNSGDIVHFRTRHYVVESAAPGTLGTVAELACMDDISQGSQLSVIWELELPPAASSQLLASMADDVETQAGNHPKPCYPRQSPTNHHPARQGGG